MATPSWWNWYTHMLEVHGSQGHAGSSPAEGTTRRTISSMARAPRLHRGGYRFESYIVHISDIIRLLARLAQW